MKPEDLQQAVELYDRFTHEDMDRRDFFGRMTVLAGSAAAASGLIASIAASPAAAEAGAAAAGREGGSDDENRRSAKENDSRKHRLSLACK